MTTWAGTVNEEKSWIREKIFLGMSFKEYLLSLATPLNFVALVILCIGLPITIIRFTQGLGSVTNLNHDNPWGLWIGFDVLCGVALAAGGYCLAATVHIFGIEDYKPIVKPAILTGFLGYFFVVIGLLYDLGRPWRLPYPLFISPGVTSFMFEVGWCVFLYLTVLAVEFSPIVFEWLGWSKFLRWAKKLTLATAVFGVILSTLHQSTLGALFILTPGKLHPLWYSPFIPIFFFISSIAAGLSMVIFESSISHRVFAHQINHRVHASHDRLTLGLGKAAAVVLFAYFCLRWISVADGNTWNLLGTEYGQLFLLEMIGFILLPIIVYLHGVKTANVRSVRIAAVWTVLGIILNRLNVSIFAFNWQMSEKYFPHWMEFAVTITIVTLGVLTFRWITNRMPVLYEHPKFPVTE